MEDINFNQLRDRAYKCACDHGFHNKTYRDQHWLMLAITEIGEAVEADRKDRHADLQSYNHPSLGQNEHPDVFKKTFEELVKDTVEDEMADVAIRLLDFAGMKGIDFTKEKEAIRIGLVGIAMRAAFMIKPEAKDCLSSFTLFAFSLCTTLTSLCKKRKVNKAVWLVLSILFWYCDSKRIDLLWHIDRKMRYNELRPYKNGKEY